MQQISLTEMTRLNRPHQPEKRIEGYRVSLDSSIERVGFLSHAANNGPLSWAMTTDSLTNIDDAELVGRCLAGDRGAYAQIVSRYQNVVCALTYAGCGDVHRSEDLAQETFVAAWKGLRELKDPA